MKTRIIAATVLLPVFFLILFVFPPFLLAFVISAVCAIAAYELLHAVKIRNKRVLVYTIIAAVLTPMVIYLSNLPLIDADMLQAEGTSPVFLNDSYSFMLLMTLLFSLFFIFVCFLVIEAVLTIKNAKAIEKGVQLKFRQIPIALAGGMLIPLMLSCLINLRTLPFGHLFVLLPVIITIMTDSGAYFTGITIGKKKPFPNISPNKTVEGCVGGIIAGTLGMLIYGLILSYATPLTVFYPILILYGIVGAVMTELGDLAFSWIKRKCGIKDYGRLIPGHGGALDRFDSMTFAAPTMYLLLMALPAFVL